MQIVNNKLILHQEGHTILPILNKLVNSRNATNIIDVSKVFIPHLTIEYRANNNNI